MLTDRIRYIIRLKDSHHKLAFSFSIGVFIGISPFWGFHTMLGLIASWMFRLNTFATISGIYLLPFWSLLPLYVFSTWIGIKSLGAEYLILNIKMENITLPHIFFIIESLFLPFLFGTFIIGSLLAFLCYIFIYLNIKQKEMS
ncbi:MAG: DUF2062 domain-containing protein [Nitrospirae bacterium]|nr:DUF2062 domain-containing protein [Nitrospirota bacterium]